MEKVEYYQQIVADTLREYAVSNVPGMEDQVVLAFVNNHFQLVTVGWNDGKYLFLPLFHRDIKSDGKIWIMANNTDVRIAEEFIQKGVSRTDIVLGFQPESIQTGSAYAVA